MKSGSNIRYQTSTKFYTYEKEIYQIKGSCKKFRKQLAEVISDNEELLSRVNEEKMCAENIEEIIAEYNK